MKVEIGGKLVSLKENNTLKRSSVTKRVIFAVVLAIFIIYAISLIYPFVWLTTSSLKEAMEYAGGNSFALPKTWKFDNYVRVFDLLVVNETNYFGMLLNSLWFTAGMTAISITICAMTAYSVSKYKFKLRGLIYGLAVFSMVIPVVGALPAQYKLAGDLGIYNSPLYLISATGGFGFNFFVLYGFFKSISWSYAEAALIDGAGNHTVFWRIMLPQAKAPMLSLAIIASIGVWNDYMTPLLYLPDFPTVASGLYEYESNMIRLADYPVYFAGIFISVIPIFTVFIIFQKTIMENIVAGGLKG